MVARSPAKGRAGRIVWVGHGTVLLDLEGVRLLTDPLLRGRVSGLRRQVPAPDPELCAVVDAVLLSHLHLDHLDLPSLKMVGRETPVVVPRGGGRLLARAGFRRAVEVGAGEEVRIGALKVRATHAEHPGARLPFGPRTSAVGYVVEGDRRIYYAGDTGPFGAMAEIGRPHLDVALLPVGGWGPLAPLWERLPTSVPGHLDPRRAAEALGLLGPLVAVPVHWGTYAPPGLGRAMSASSDDPPRAFRRYAAGLAPGVEVRVLYPGEALGLDAITAGRSR